MVRQNVHFPFGDWGDSLSVMMNLYLYGLPNFHCLDYSSKVLDVLRLTSFRNHVDEDKRRSLGIRFVGCSLSEPYENLPGSVDFTGHPK